MIILLLNILLLLQCHAALRAVAGITLANFRVHRTGIENAARYALFVVSARSAMLVAMSTMRHVSATAKTHHQKKQPRKQQ
jgi:uncharacterized membrane protein YcgQ (UPF0703/DUF1980 family)